MSLVRLSEVSIAFGARSLLERASLAIERGERVALVGRNGEGKSTLLKLVEGTLAPDAGELVRATGLTVASLPQSLPPDLAGTVYAVVAAGLAETGRLLAEHHDAAVALAAASSQATGTDAATAEAAARLARLHDRLDAVDGWTLANEVERTLSRLDLPADADIGSLSGGQKRRVLLARALVASPDVLLLDEPTNHLDIGAIAALETTLAELPSALLLVTHDRAFLDAVATRIVEIDRGRLSEWPGSYARYRELKVDALAAEAAAFAAADRVLAREEVWIRQGIKARRTRNEGRVRALERLREARRARREMQGAVRLGANLAERSGKLVLEAEGLAFAAGGREIVAPLELVVARGDRLGIVGPNGCGKTTLARLLLGELAPTAGRLRHGTRLEIAYLDQHRDALDGTRSAVENVAGGREAVRIGGAERHVMSYLQDFLFEPARARAPITALSGGERARLALAKLFAVPSNVLVLDEPSNDLDIETLELVEAMLGDYPGTVILISHDRALLDNTVTRTLVFQGDGRFVDVAGGWSDFERELRDSGGRLVDPFALARADEARTHGDGGLRRGAAGGAVAQSTRGSDRGGTAARAAAGDRAAAVGGSAAKAAQKRQAKLSYKLARELESLPDEIACREGEIETLNAAMGEADFFADEKRSRETLSRVAALQRELEALYARWEELEGMANGG